jgi:predicted DCC family thiol-disulfide oxidoreductase YuxK
VQDNHLNLRLAPCSMIIVFDGVCNFCNGWVRFVLRRDRKRRFLFAAAQSETGSTLLSKLSFSPANLDTIVLFDGSKHHVKSDAVLEIFGHLDGPWPALTLFAFLPRKLRDLLYSAFAKRRYKFFGATSCPLPDSRWDERLLT